MKRIFSRHSLVLQMASRVPRYPVGNHWRKALPFIAWSFEREASLYA